MKHLGPLALLTMAVWALPCAAQAQGQVAFTAKTVNLRAGPARDYPIVAVLPAGYQVAVQGCLPDYRWCDVAAGPHRGWVYGGNINYSYQNTYVPVLNYGAIIGIGVLAFVLDDYWGHYYPDRPWYGERHRWLNRPAPHYSPAPRFNPPPRHDAAPRYNRPTPRADVIGPRRPDQPRGVVPRPPDNSGGVLPGPQPRPHPQTAPAPHPRPQPGAAPAPRVRPQQGAAPGADRHAPSPRGEAGARAPRGDAGARAPRGEAGERRGERESR